MPTESRTSPSGIVAGSVFQRRRRSNVDSTPPSEVACTHSFVLWVSRSAASAPWASTIDDDAAEARVADLADRRVPGQPAHQLLGVRLGPLDPQVQGAQAAQRQPRLEGAGDRAEQVAPALQHGVQLVVAGDHRAHEHVAVAGEVLRRRVHDQVDVELQRRLQQGSGEGVVDDDVGAGLVRGRRGSSRCPRPPGPGWSATPARPGPRPSQAATTASVSVMSTSSVAQPAAGLEVGQLQHGAVVGVPGRDHLGAAGRPGPAPSRRRPGRTRSAGSARPRGRRARPRTRSRSGCRSGRTPGRRRRRTSTPSRSAR